MAETKRVLVTVRTYPTPAKKGVETSCTAGITDEGKWIRLFPLPYRRLKPEQRFSKYDWIEVQVRKASDARPESFNPDCDSLRILPNRHVGTGHGWQDRKDIVFPLRSHCLCCLKEECDAHGAPTLGVFKPKSIERFSIDKGTDQWTADQLEALRQSLQQPGLFKGAAPPAQELEKIPYDFRYAFRCDERRCRGHHLLCTDWELSESYRKWRGPGWEAKLRQRYEAEMVRKYDTHFYVGTVHRYPGTWIIVGLFYPPPPKTDLQGTLPGLGSN